MFGDSTRAALLRKEPMEQEDTLMQEHRCVGKTARSTSCSQCTLLPADALDFIVVHAPSMALAVELDVLVLRLHAVDRWRNRGTTGESFAERALARRNRGLDG